MIFLYIPLGVLISVNLILYLLTMAKMRQQRKETTLAREQSNQSNTDAVMVNARLLCIMGVTWSLELMTWCFDKPNLFFEIINGLCDICNSLQGVFIFILFVMRPHVWKLLINR
jgi:G protein-coupled receptor Mth (Methuselah protein)